MGSTIETILEGRNGKQAVMAPGRRLVVIGERLNPTNRKKLAAQLQAGDMTMARADARRQVEQGADVIDVNVGFAGSDEPVVMAAVVEAVMKEVEVPLCIDSANLQATEAGLKTFAEHGGKKALVNSTTGEDERMGKFLPLAAEYSAAIIGLAHDERGIDFEVDHRLEAAAKILDRAGKYGIPRSDVVIDALTLAVGANTNAGRVTLDTQLRVTTELQANTTSGASNVSFGLPDRKLINLAYLPLLISRGLTSAITNPLEDSIYNVILASDLLMGHDADARRWIEAFRKRRAAEDGSG